MPESLAEGFRRSPGFARLLSPMRGGVVPFFRLYPLTPQGLLG